VARLQNNPVALSGVEGLEATCFDEVYPARVAGLSTTLLLQAYSTTIAKPAGSSRPGRFRYVS